MMRLADTVSWSVTGHWVIPVNQILPNLALFRPPSSLTSVIALSWSATTLFRYLEVRLCAPLLRSSRARL